MPRAFIDNQDIVVTDDSGNVYEEQINTLQNEIQSSEFHSNLFSIVNFTCAGLVWASLFWFKLPGFILFLLISTRGRLLLICLCMAVLCIFCLI